MTFSMYDLKLILCLKKLYSASNIAYFQGKRCVDEDAVGCAEHILVVGIL